MQIFEGFFIVANAAYRNMLLFRSNSPPAGSVPGFSTLLGGSRSSRFTGRTLRAKIRLREENILLPSVAYFAKEEVATFYL